MTTRKYLISTTLLTLLSLTLSGCGGSNDSKEDVEAVTASCSDDILTYQTLNSGDVIAKADTLITDEDDESTSTPQFSILQADDGSKRVCISSGSAVIIRS